MKRKSFFYPKTRTRRFFIDGKRVSQKHWFYTETLAQMKGLVYNSSFTVTRKDGVIIGGHCLD